MSSYVIHSLSHETSLAQAGGKGKSLSELARAGFPVPPGYVITTDAYRLFVDANQLQSRILSLAGSKSLEDPTDPAALESTSAEICSLFEAGTMPSELTAEITLAY